MWAAHQLVPHCGGGDDWVKECNSTGWMAIPAPQKRRHGARGVEHTPSPGQQTQIFGRRGHWPVFLLHQVSLVDLLVLYFLILVILLGGWGCRSGGRGGGVRRRAAHVLCAVELVNATRLQHAVAVQHHGAFRTSLSGQKGSVLLPKIVQSILLSSQHWYFLVSYKGMKT